MSQGARILIVEDELPMRTVLHDALSGQGYRVIVANDGQTGLDKALSDKPDLILLDVMMPRIDGFAVCAQLRKLMQAVPVLMLTAKGSVEDRVRGLDAGADDYLAKPFSREELLARVRALLRRTQREMQALKEIKLGEVRVDFVRQRAWRAGWRRAGRSARDIGSKRWPCLRSRGGGKTEPVAEHGGQCERGGGIVEVRSSSSAVTFVSRQP